MCKHWVKSEDGSYFCKWYDAVDIFIGLDQDICPIGSRCNYKKWYEAVKANDEGDCLYWPPKIDSKKIKAILDQSYKIRESKDQYRQSIKLIKLLLHDITDKIARIERLMEDEDGQ
jgi:hypothetical protein